MDKLIYLSFGSKRRFGVEMEVNRHITREGLARIVQSVIKGSRSPDVRNWCYSQGNSAWVVKTDSSCGDHGNKNIDGGGYEVVSKVGHGPKHLKEIAKVAAALRSGGAQINDYCGFHCHVEIRDFSTMQASTLLAYWCKIERLMSNIVPVRRTTSKHCVPHTLEGSKWEQAKNLTDCARFWDVMKLRSLEPPAKRNTMTLVNWQRSQSRAGQWVDFDRPTVELRMPEGSLHASDVKNWARLFIHFVEQCSKYPFPADLQPVDLNGGLEILGLSKLGGFSIPSFGLFETKLWLLSRIQKYGATKDLVKQAKEIETEMTIPEVRPEYGF